MRNLYLRIYATVVAVLLLFALVAGWVFQRNAAEERERLQVQWGDRAAGWAALLENSLPPGSAAAEEQSAALLDWSQRLRLPMALEDADGRRIATSESFARRAEDASTRRAVRLLLSDGRALWIWRPGPPPAGRTALGEATERRPGGMGLRPAFGPPPWAGGGVGLVVTLVLLFVAVALGAYPVVRRLTRRLEALKQGVEAFGAGQLSHRVDAGGRDEIAAVAASFNGAAQRIQSLVDSHRHLLANASHELRSPLARLKMALSLLEGADAAGRKRLREEIERNIRELDSLVEEVLLASRLDAQPELDPLEPVALLPLAAEEASRFNASVEGADISLQASERLLRRAVRNLLENARRYAGAQPAEVRVSASGGEVAIAVCDRGPGIPAAERERIFEPFYRLAGHAEQAGGVGLGLSLVRQIARRHGGRAHVEPREGGGSCFVLTLPLQPAGAGI